MLEMLKHHKIRLKQKTPNICFVWSVSEGYNFIVQLRMSDCYLIIRNLF